MAVGEIQSLSANSSISKIEKLSTIFKFFG